MARLPDSIQVRDRDGRRQYRAVVTDRTRRLDSGSFARLGSRWFDRQGEAVEWRDATLADMKRDGHVVIERTLDVESACRRWLLEASTIGIDGRAPVRGSTKRRYERTIDNVIVPTLGRRPCAEIRASELRMWATAQTLGGDSDEASRGLAVLRQAFGMMVGLDMMSSNPARDVRMSRTASAKVAARDQDEDDGEVRVFLEPDEVRRMLDAADSLSEASGGRGSSQRRKAWVRYLPMAYVLFGCGVRIGEALALRWRDLDLDAGVMHVRWSLDDEGRVTRPKTQSAIRTLALGDHVLRTLCDLKSRRGGEVDGECFVFGGRTPLDRANAVNRMWNPLMAEAGLEGFSFHDARHYHASALISGGMKDVDVSARLGHSSVSITRKIYVHCFRASEGRREEHAVQLEGVILGR